MALILVASFCRHSVRKFFVQAAVVHTGSIQVKVHNNHSTAPSSPGKRLSQRCVKAFHLPAACPSPTSNLTIETTGPPCRRDSGQRSSELAHVHVCPHMAGWSTMSWSCLTATPILAPNVAISNAAPFHVRSSLVTSFSDHSCSVTSRVRLM